MNQNQPTQAQIDAATIKPVAWEENGIITVRIFASRGPILDRLRLMAAMGHYQDYILYMLSVTVADFLIGFDFVMNPLRSDDLVECIRMVIWAMQSSDPFPKDDSDLVYRKGSAFYEAMLQAGFVSIKNAVQYNFDFCESISYEFEDDK